MMIYCKWCKRGFAWIDDCKLHEKYCTAKVKEAANFIIDRIDGTRVASMEHFDQNESNGNAATKYVVEFTGNVNCEWLWATLDKALKEAQRE